MDFVIPILSQSALKVSIYTVVFHKVAAWGRFYVSCQPNECIWDLQRGKNHPPSIHVYADDIQLYLSFKPLSTSLQHDALRALIYAGTAEVRAWMITSWLKINDTKMEFLLVGSYQQLSKVQFEPVTVGILKSSLFPASAISGHGFSSPWAFMWAKSAVRPSAVYIPSDRPVSDYREMLPKCWFTFL